MGADANLLGLSHWTSLFLLYPGMPSLRARRTRAPHDRPFLI